MEKKFFEYYFNRNKNLTNENILQISLYKFVYFYLIEPKRLLGVDLFAIDLRYTYMLNRLYSSDTIYPYEEYDLNCLTDRCVCLRSNQIIRIIG
jgi:hypothetical protein